MTFSRTRAVIFLAVLGLVANAGIANAAIVSYDGSNRPTSITGLAVDGTTYNVSIFWDTTSFFDLFGDPNALSLVPTFWGSESGANDAASAVAAASNPAPGVAPLYNIILTPFDLAGDIVRGVEVVYYSESLGWYYWGSNNIGGLYPDQPAATFAWAVYTPASQAVPEPSTLLLWSGLGAIGAVMAYRRKRRAA
jgi:hypothetical protein